MAEAEERTEQATPRRRQKAREEGQFARSRELTSLAATVGTVAVFAFGGTALVERALSLFVIFLDRRIHGSPVDVLRYASVETLRMLAPFFVAATALSLTVTVAQQGGFVFKPLGLKFERLNPLTGLRRLFSVEGMGDTVKSLIKFIVVGVVMYLTIKRILPTLPFMSVLEFRPLVDLSAGLVKQAVLNGVLVFAFVAVADFLYEWWKFERSIRMSREEIKQEYRESDGDPQIKARIKSIQRDMARRRMMQAVPKATVVITNPTHLAVALSYDRRKNAAPKIVAKGAGFVAQAIRELARKHGVPVMEDKPLARALFKREVGSYIPEELYRAVAKILAYIYKLRGEVSS